VSTAQTRRWSPEPRRTAVEPRFTRGQLITAVLLIGAAIWACIVYGVATVLGWITGAPAFLLSLADMVVAAR